MLHAFLSANRDDLIDRCRLKVAQRRAPKPTDAELEHGIPHFLDQLIKTLQVEQTPEPMRSRDVSGESGGEGSVFSEIGAMAAQHGRELLQHGYTVDQVVHGYALCTLEHVAGSGFFFWGMRTMVPSVQKVRWRFVTLRVVPKEQ